MSDPRKRAGRGLWRAVYASLVDHEDFRALSSNARLVLFVLRLGPSTTIASIFHYYREVLQAQTGLSARALETALQELGRTPSADQPWIVRDASVLWVRNGLRFDPNLSLANDNHVVAIRRAVAALPQRSAVVQQFLNYYPMVGPIEEGMGASHVGRVGASHGGITSSSSTPTPTPKQEPNSETAGDASPAPPSGAAAPSVVVPDPSEPGPTATATPRWGTPETLVELYNAMAPAGHPKVQSLSDGRRKKAQGYLRQFPSEAFWRQVFTAIGESDFLQHGGKDRPGFRGDFDWLLQRGQDGTENCVKAAEGKYRGGAANGGSDSRCQVTAGWDGYAVGEEVTAR